MQDINDLMPKISNMKWGAVTNIFPTQSKINQLDHILPHDGKWNLIFEEQNQVHINGKTIRKITRESMT